MTEPRPQPVINWAAIAAAFGGLVATFGAFLVFFGYTTEAEVGAFAALCAKVVVAIGVLVAAAGPILAALKARKQVTPLSSPVSADGQPLMTAEQWIQKDQYGQHAGPPTPVAPVPSPPTVPYEPYQQLKANADALDTPIYAATAELNAMAPAEPEPTPSPTPASPADWVTWAEHVLTLKGQSQATLAVAREIIAAAGGGEVA